MVFQVLYWLEKTAGAEAQQPLTAEPLAAAIAGHVDVEAHVFWALSILGTRARGESDPRTAIQAAAILEELFPTHPDHPGVLHYLIHAYDDPVHAPLGLRAARRYAHVASSAPHALHMPSHIFVQLGMWDDAARSNEAAYALSKQWGKPDMHSLEWLEYAYLQQHRYPDAKRLIAEANSIYHARENMQIRYALETGEWSAFEFDTPFGRGMRAIVERRLSDAQHAIDELSASKERGADAERLELMALLDSARGDTASALRTAKLAIAAEQTLGVPSGPPEDFKPANELYGELLLRSGKSKEALEQFQTSLLRTPNRAMSLAGVQRATSDASRSSRSSGQQP